jgi:hypothetical protein
MGKLHHLACFLIDDPIDTIANLSLPPKASYHFIADAQGVTRRAKLALRIASSANVTLVAQSALTIQCGLFQ